MYIYLNMYDYPDDWFLITNWYAKIHAGVEGGWRG